jgi:hypothetical protein
MTKSESPSIAKHFSNLSGMFGDICSLHFKCQCYINVMLRKSRNSIATRSSLCFRAVLTVIIKDR